MHPINQVSAVKSLDVLSGLVHSDMLLSSLGQTASLIIQEDIGCQQGPHLPTKTVPPSPRQGLGPARRLGQKAAQSRQGARLLAQHQRQQYDHEVLMLQVPF